jgi:hypothetical protein
MGGEEHNRYAYARGLSQQERSRRQKKARTEWINSLRKKANRR